MTYRLESESALKQFAGSSSSDVSSRKRVSPSLHCRLYSPSRLLLYLYMYSTERDKLNCNSRLVLSKMFMQHQNALIILLLYTEFSQGTIYTSARLWLTALVGQR